MLKKTAAYLPLFIPFAMVLPSLQTTPASGAEISRTACPATREYITALEFIRSREDLAVKDQAAQTVASRVSEGCEGAAKRFIGTVALLREAELNSDDAINVGLELAKRTDAEAATFSSVFKRAFTPEYLDLDVHSALQMARELSTGLKTDQTAVRRDFESLLNFCTHSKYLDLPRPGCGAFAMRITKKGEAFGGGVAQPFSSAFEFLISGKGPSLTTGDALKLSEELISRGPGAVDNFTLAYRYAVSEKGMNAPREAAIAFARKMAERKTAEPSNSEKER